MSTSTPLVAFVALVALVALVFGACAPPRSDPAPHVDPLADGAAWTAVIGAVAGPHDTGGTLGAWGASVVAADTLGDRLVILAGGAAASVPLPAGSRPTQLLVRADRAFVSLHGEGAVAAVDLSAGQVDWIREVCPSPRGLTVDDRAGELLVACASGELVHLDADRGTVVDLRLVAPDLRDVVIDGEITWVSSFREARVHALVGGEVVASYVPKGVNVPVGDTWRFMAPDVAWRMVAHPDGGVLVLHQRATVAPLDIRPDDEPGERGNGYGDPVPFDEPLCNPVVHTALSHMRLGEVPESSPGLALPPTVTDLLVLDDEPRFLLASPGLHGLKPWQASVTRFRSEVLQERDACVVGEPWEDALPDARHVSAITVADGVVHGLGLYPLEVFGPSGWVGPADVPADREARIGFELFHTDRGVGIACASCHAEGQEDGRVWNFGDDGLRRTASLAPGLALTAPYHWNGELADFRALLVDTMVNRMGGTLPPMRDIEALAAWIEGVPRVRVTVDAEAEAIARGELLFREAALAKYGWPQELELGDSNQVSTFVVFNGDQDQRIRVLTGNSVCRNAPVPNSALLRMIHYPPPRQGGHRFLELTSERSLLVFGQVPGACRDSGDDFSFGFQFPPYPRDPWS